MAARALDQWDINRVRSAVADTIRFAVDAEKNRCANLVRAARRDEIDSDLRTLIHLIESGRDIDDVLASNAE